MPNLPTGYCIDREDTGSEDPLEENLTHCEHYTVRNSKVFTVCCWCKRTERQYDDEARKHTAHRAKIQAGPRRTT